MNCMVLEHDQRLLIIDCGTNFPGDDYGVEVVHPDFGWLRDHWSRVEGVVLTHGHEDHIGGVPYLLAERDVPIWGPPHALRLVKRRLAEHAVALAPPRLTEVRAGDRISLGPFDIEPVRVSHSIVEATALVIRTSAGTVVHSGDFKFDPAPSDGEPTDESRLRAVGDEGVDLLLSDSTNVDSEGSAGSEADVEVALDQLVRGASRRVFVALFASNVQRLISLGKIAVKRGRKICLLGRSLVTHVEIARDLGHLNWPRDLVLPAERARSYPKAELLVLATGTQAEPAAAMARLARGEHPIISVEEGDTVAFSSRIIPGCDRPVVEMMGQLLRRGALVESRWTAPIHTSGHANRADLARMIELVRPANLVPVHGTVHHMHRHAELGRECNVPGVRVLENGQTVVLAERRLRPGESVRSGKVHVALGGRVISPEVLERRRDLGRSGVVSISVVCDSRNRLRGTPTVAAVGLPGFGELVPFEELSNHLVEHWRSINRAATPHADARPSGHVERCVSRWVDLRFGLRPVVVVHIIAATLD
jgi:ribonuclease J